MLSHNLKRYLSLFLSFLMVFSMMPVSVLAADVETHDHSHEVMEEIAPNTQGDGSSTEANPEIVRFQEMIDEILTNYVGSAALTVEEVKAAAEALSDESCEEAWYEIMVLEEEMNFAYNDALVNEDELEALVNANLTMDAFIGVITSKVVAPSVSFFATTVSPIEGVSVTDSSSTGSLSNGTVTITAKGGWFSSSRTTNTITVANTSGKPGKLSFDYSLTNHYGTTLPLAQGSYSSDMAKDGSYEFTITSKGSSATATLTLSNFQFEEAAATANVTVEYDSAMGSVTAAGSAIASGSTIQDVSTSEGAALVATPKSGTTFLGWINQSTHERLSTAASYTYTPIGNSTVAAAFANADAKAWFSVGTKYYDDLNAAAAAAVSGGGVVILAANGTLPAGNYTIPSGVTLLIPYNSDNTLCTTKPTIDGSTGFLSSSANAWVSPTAYRTLHMATGANIAVNGAISLSGKMCINQERNGCPSGPLGFVNMASGSTITVNSGAKLYVWGYITGSGAVTVKSGGTVYENFQVRDWRGGTAASGMIDKTQKVFPVSQYYVQNVEVPMALETGAKEYAYMGLVASKCYGDATVPFIGSGSMFINSGTIIKDYNENKDRLEVDVSGNLSMSSLVLSVKTNIAKYDMNSANYVLPITNNLTVKVNSGITTISQDMCMLPGSEIIVGKNATVQLASGSNLYVYDLDEWSGKLFVYPAKDVSPLSYVGGKKGAPVARTLSDAKIVVNGLLDASAGFLYTTTGGANITSDGGGQVVTGTAGTATVTYQATQGGSDGTTITFAEVPITSAKLLNKDTSYQETTTANITYTYTDGKWICQTHTDVDKNHTCDVCGFKTECADGDGNELCDVCGASLCNHTNTELQGNEEATCEKDGYTGDKVCTSCGKIVETGTTIESVGHSYESTTIDATCTEDGSTTYTCSSCGDSYSETISALGHTASGDWLSDGENHYKLCGVCSEATEIEAHSGGTATCMTPATCEICKQSYGSVDSNNHNFSAEWSTDGSGHWKVCLNGCSVKGSAGNHTGGTANCVDLAVCETCQTAYGNVDGSNHKTVKTDAAQAPDCTNTGLTEGSHCEACNTVITAQTTVDALGHEAGAEATCTTAQTCTRCTYVYEAALGHSYTNYVSNNDAKCEVDGTETAQCDRCDETHTRTDEGSALGHSYTNYTVYEEATCQRNETQIACCDNGCGGTNIKTIENSTVDHTYGEYVSDNNATCLNNGTQTATCIWCEATDTVTVEDSALGHNWGEYVSDGNATCLNNGTMTRTCGRCELTETVTETDSALGHSFTNYVPNDDAVCGKDGTKTATCDRCDATDTVANEGSALVHQFTNYTYNNDAKCGVDGTKTAVCDHGCGATDTITAEGTALTHSYTNYVSNGDATCTQDGTKSAYCVHGCGTKDTVADEGSALGHNFTNYVSNNNATCTANGTETGTCSRCDATDIREIPNSILPHSYTNYTSNGDATCTADGTKTAKCDYCTSTTTVTDEGSMLDHSYGDWKVETSATCTAEGSSRRECSRCDAFETRVDAATNHSMGDWYISNPTTCEISGEKRRDCAVCEYYETEVIEALSHNYTSAVTKQPTCVDKGERTFTCSNCQNSYTQEIAATGVHTEATREENRTEATCGVNGSYNLVTYCSVCTQVLKTEAKVIPATGAHNYESEVTVEPTCIAVGERTYTCTVCQDSYTEEIEKAPHTVSQEYTTENGKHYHKCTTEGCTYVEDEAECSGGKATCKDLAVCEICSEAYGELDPENHVGGTTIKDASAATCTSPGYTGDTYCLSCNTKIDDGESISTASHHYSSSVTKEATCVEAGVKTYTCSGCGYSYTEEIPVTDNHDWKAATYTAPKTCSVCKLTEGEPLVDVENPENIPAEDIEEALDAMVKVTDAIQPEDSGMEADTNKGQLEETTTAAGGISYNTSLIITLNAVVVEKDGEAMIAKKITYDVIPMLHILNEAGIQIGEQKITSFESEITFRLPVDKNTTAGFARVWHAETENLGLHKIQTDADGNKFVEVKSKKFSEFTLELEEECTEHTYGEDGKCTICGAEKPVAACPYTFGQTSQMYLEEPWGVRVNLRVYHAKEDGSKGARLTVAEMSAIDDYGVYFLRARDLTDANATQDTLTVEDIINNPNVFVNSKADGSAWQNTSAPADGTGNCFTSDFREGIYTYRLSESIYVMYYIIEDGVTYYAPIRERNPSELVNKGINEAAYADYDRAILSAMSALEQSSLTYRAQFDSDEALETMDAPTLAENPLGTPVEYTDHSFSFGHTRQIIVAEPWGLQFNGKVALDREYDDYGVVVYYNNTGKEVSISTAEDLLAISDAYVFSVRNGDATLSVQESDGRTVISAIYNSGLYTHQMTEIAYVMFYIQDGDNIYCGPVKERTIQSEIENYLNNTKDQIIIALLNDMKALYNAVDTKYEIMGWK